MATGAHPHLCSPLGPALRQTAKNRWGKHKPPNPPSSHSWGLRAGLNPRDRCHPPKAGSPPEGEPRGGSVTGRLIRQPSRFHLQLHYELLSSGRRWQGTGETGARACHATWRRLPLTQASSVFSSSGYMPCLADMSQPCSALLSAFLMWPDNRTLN